MTREQIEAQSRKVVADYVATLRQERGLAAPVITRKALRPTTTKEVSMTDSEILRDCRNRHRLTPQVQKYVASQIVKRCLTPQSDVVAKQVLAKIEALLPSRLALLGSMLALKIEREAKEARERRLPRLGMTPCRRYPTAL
jgi:hypothetical protein